MFVAIVHVPAPPDPDAAAVLERRFAERLPHVAGAPGFAGFELLRPAAGARDYLSISRWETRAAFDAWVQSSANAQAHSRPGATGPGAAASAAGALPPGVELYELAEG